MTTGIGREIDRLPLKALTSQIKGRIEAVFMIRKTGYSVR
jgi:hypothetical protein